MRNLTQLDWLEEYLKANEIPYKRVDEEYPVPFSREMFDHHQIIVYNIVSSATEWILFKTRPMDEEERKEWSEKLGYNLEHEDAVIYTGQLPDDGQEVIVCSKYGHIWIDTFEIDPDYGVGFEENGDMDGLVAWMPLPEPYKGEGEEE